MGIIVEGHPQPPGLGLDALFRLVSPNYLETIGARLLEGRLLQWSDRMETLPVVVVNEKLAKQYWPNDSALGKRIDTGTGDGVPKWMTIVGVVRDVRERGVDLASKGAVYVPYTQTTIGFFQPSEIAILNSRDPQSIAKELQSAVAAADPEQPVSRIVTMESIVDNEFSNRSQIMQLLAAFAALSLLLAMSGVYAVLSYVVSLKRREIGLRMAVGASPRDVRREMAFYSFKRIAFGLALGLLAAVATTRLLASLLFGVSALDPATFVAVAAALATIAVAAAWAPLMRCTKIDPIIVLRSE
jgi:predicted permease